MNGGIKNQFQKIGLVQLSVDDKVRRVSGLYIISVLIHGVVDPGLTYIIVVNKETWIEANLLLRSLFNQGWITVIVGHIPLFCISIFCFLGLLYLFNIAEGKERKQLYWLSQLILGLCIIWGTLLVSWNLYAWIR